MAEIAETYNVGGVLFARPFRLRRLGHFGVYAERLDAARAFYSDLLGFRLTDAMAWKPPRSDPRQLFATHGTDHHSFVLADAEVGRQRDDRYARGITVNQISFQVGTLEEVVNANGYFSKHGVRHYRSGRDSPGSNWAVYVLDPDGHTIELFYGMEQIGWDRRSKPEAMHYLHAPQLPATLPQPSESAELLDALRRGIDFHNGACSTDGAPDRYVVGGVTLPRPFKITKIGPVHLFVADLEAAARFYVERLGLTVTEEVVHAGHRVVFLRHGSEHHSVGLLPVQLREVLGLARSTTLASFGLELGSYAQLREAVGFLRGKGVTFVETVPPELHPGIDYAAHILDPDGHCLRLYYCMEQVGWDGKPRPKEARRKISKEWPETLDAASDTYVDQTFHGPLG